MDTRKIFMRELVIEIGGNRRPQQSIADWLEQVAKAAGLHPRAVRQVWYREPNISFETARKLKAAAEKKQNEARNTAARLESLISRMEKNDEEFHREDIDALRALLMRSRNVAGGAE